MLSQLHTLLQRSVVACPDPCKLRQLCSLMKSQMDMCLLKKKQEFKNHINTVCFYRFYKPNVVSITSTLQLPRYYNIQKNRKTKTNTIYQVYFAVNQIRFNKLLDSMHTAWSFFIKAGEIELSLPTGTKAESNNSEWSYKSKIGIRFQEITPHLI